MTQSLLAAQRQAEEAAKARNKASQECGDEATKYDEAKLALDQQTGAISRNDAAM